MKRHGFDRSRAVKVLATGVRSATARAADDFDNHVQSVLARQMFEMAGIGPDEVDVAEVHDAASLGELTAMENCGLCKPGESGVMAERGDTTIGGKLPINPSGGLESKGHPIGATGTGQIFEIVQQLRGECGERQVEGARIGIQVNGGGLWGIEESTDHIGIFGRA
ncbi:MAG: thiolase family protein [Proteobacteria bacterium]|nr:thiolase family protein [Pseudomonadota bacterium]